MAATVVDRVLWSCRFTCKYIQVGKQRSVIDRNFTGNKRLSFRSLYYFQCNNCFTLRSTTSTPGYCFCIKYERSIWNITVGIHTAGAVSITVTCFLEYLGCADEWLIDIQQHFVKWLCFVDRGEFNFTLTSHSYSHSVQLVKKIVNW